MDHKFSNTFFRKTQACQLREGVCARSDGKPGESKYFGIRSQNEMHSAQMEAGHPRHDVAEKYEKAIGGRLLGWRQKCSISLGTRGWSLPGKTRSTHSNATWVKLPQDSSDLADGLDRGDAALQQSDEDTGGTTVLSSSGRFRAKESDREVFHMGWPLGS